MASNGSARPKKKIAARTVNLPWDEANAVVEEVFPKQCRVKTGTGSGLISESEALLCSYRWAGIISKASRELRERTPVCVGDRVRAQKTADGVGVIDGICERKNSISRPAPGRDGLKLQHALASNLDLLVIVVSVRDPLFSPGLVDRFLIAAEAEKIPVLICVTKVDLKPEGSDTPWKLYSDLGYRVLEVSAKAGLGILELIRETVGKTAAFCGQSGVGKTSLLRTLIGKEVGRVDSVNAFTGKGKHTTTGAVILDGPQSSRWIDTPGVREFGLANVSPETLVEYFPEFRSLKCKNSDCLHNEEPECIARGLPRYSSYFRILKSLMAGEF